MSAKIVHPPSYRYKQWTSDGPSIFLAGSIEMGAATDWQADLVEKLKDHASIIYNPRRPDWDSSWEQTIEHPEFNVQVNWELEMIEEADLVIFYFDPATKSPITLMELGFVAGFKAAHTVVCCPEGFWRKGNVDIMCERMRIRMVPDLDTIITSGIVKNADAYTHR